MRPLSAFLFHRHLPPSSPEALAGVHYFVKHLPTCHLDSDRADGFYYPYFSEEQTALLSSHVASGGAVPGTRAPCPFHYASGVELGATLLWWPEGGQVQSVSGWVGGRGALDWS